MVVPTMPDPKTSARRWMKSKSSMSKTLTAALTLPGVVDVHVGPAVAVESVAHDRLGRGEGFLLVDLSAPAVPTVPAHRRCQRDGVADDDAEWLLRRASRILRGKHDLMGAALSLRPYF